MGAIVRTERHSWAGALRATVGPPRVQAGDAAVTRRACHVPCRHSEPQGFTHDREAASSAGSVWHAGGRGQRPERRDIGQRCGSQALEVAWMPRDDPMFLFSIYFIFTESGGEGEREGETHPCVVASHAPPTGDPAHNPGICPDWELNQQPFGLQASPQSTEQQQPG